MVLVRNVFRLKFGKAKEAVEHWKQGTSVLKQLNFSKAPVRLLTDLAGADFYTLVMESTHDSIGDYEHAAFKIMNNDDWKRWYQNFVPLVESGHREIFSIVNQ